MFRKQVQPLRVGAGEGFRWRAFGNLDTTSVLQTMSVTKFVTLSAVYALYDDAVAGLNLDLGQANTHLRE
jgi:hypothetical protein